LNKTQLKIGWFFDFDKGMVEKPHTIDLEILAPWVSKQRKYWLKEVRNPKYCDKNICLFGVGLFPWKVGDPDDIAFAYISLDQDERKKHLNERGDPHIWHAYNKDIREIVKKLDDGGVKKFDYNNKTVEQMAAEIRTWLESI
jgi:hypothetical protein